jgi:hypothetical protein
VAEQPFEFPAELGCTFIADAIGRNCGAETVVKNQHTRFV